MHKPLADAFLVDVLPPLLRQALGPSVFESFYFIRYQDPDYHLRLRFLGDRHAVWGNPRREVLKVLKEACAKIPESRLKTDRYRPEFRRYGGRFGMRVAESIFSASSHLVLDFMRLQANGLKLGKIAFAALSAEVMLESLGLASRERQEAWRLHALWRPLDPQKLKETLPSYQPLFQPVLEPIASDLKACVASQPAKVQAALKLFQKRLKPLGRAWLPWGRRIGKPLRSLVHTYTHMHLNRLAIPPLHEALLSFLRAQAKKDFEKPALAI